VHALQALAAEVATGRLALHAGAPLEPTLVALRALPGIGDWTAQLIAMRALAWPDAFPATDIGILNALGTREVAQVRAQAEAWRPWRAYAVIRLWQALAETPVAASAAAASGVSARPAPPPGGTPRAAIVAPASPHAAPKPATVPAPAAPAPARGSARAVHAVRRTTPPTQEHPA
jgi:hypothetical protein